MIATGTDVRPLEIVFFMRDVHTDHNQFVYQLACSKCGHNYGANGSDIHSRRCPKCDGGLPGLPLDDGR
jgi:predicted Zn-ribbon and HTH transcriptional regulator